MYILIDGENIDATLGVNILKRPPRGEERPRWDRVLEFHPFQAQSESEDPETQSDTASARGLFFLNVSQRTAAPFIQALLAIGWQPIQLTSTDPERKIVDEGIQRTLDAILKEKPGADVVVGTHDVDYLPQLEALLDAGHRVSILCFREFLALPIAELEDKGLIIHDLELDVQAFNLPLNRTHPVDIDEFDPYPYL
ncbi:nuclease [Arcanobacterium pinnipediorum]|uniref:Nuclease n=1 Tax=Arcanobacterium pinnipediorum TaxID=1503041 RepID=A0ABY5AGQ1_9ACTO|nr:nuclease [Arcanobacterium pinnipediorum]USR79252.1 nuclease [Arcanobacterium pinnipediorum]